MYDTFASLYSPKCWGMTDTIVAHLAGTDKILSKYAKSAFLKHPCIPPGFYTLSKRGTQQERMWSFVNTISVFI